jgi:enoyl-CoA hydratase/carnithine racemase
VSTDQILLLRDGAVAHIVLNRPDRLNAIDAACLDLLQSHVAAVEADEATRAVIVRANGRAFCAGADLTAVAPLLADSARYAAFGDKWHKTYDQIAQCSKPTIAAVHGLALAGGFELLQVCDVVVLAEDARIGDQHANFGLVAGGGGTQRLPRLIGERRAKWLLLSGDWLSAADALQFGLANVVVPADRVLARAEAMAAQLASKSPLASRHVKEAVSRGMQLDLPAALALERQIVVAHMQSEDVQIGLAAFRNRSKPSFKGN